MARKRVTPTAEVLGALLTRGRESLPLSRLAMVREAWAPARDTLARWERGEHLRQLQYVVRLAHESETFRAGLATVLGIKPGEGKKAARLRERVKELAGR
ncbi:MAG: hypothetical protein ACREK5_03835 [Gemmatimonadota bacterium]